VALDDITGVVNEASDSFLNQVNPRPATQQEIKQIVEQII
jgi:alcohol dehydrogenase class IV